MQCAVSTRTTNSIWMSVLFLFQNSVHRQIDIDRSSVTFLSQLSGFEVSQSGLRVQIRAQFRKHTFSFLLSFSSLSILFLIFSSSSSSPPSTGSIIHFHFFPFRSPYLLSLSRSLSTHSLAHLHSPTFTHPPRFSVATFTLTRHAPPSTYSQQTFPPS